MSVIILTSKRFIVVDKTRKTSAHGFKDIKIDDVLEFSTQLTNTTGASGGGNYASYVKITNLTQDYSFHNSQSQLLSNLSALKLEEVSAID